MVDVFFFFFIVVVHVSVWSVVPTFFYPCLFYFIYSFFGREFLVATMFFVFFCFFFFVAGLSDFLCYFGLTFFFFSFLINDGFDDGLNGTDGLMVVDGIYSFSCLCF